MRNGSSVFLVDTNVLVYAYDPTDGSKRDRARAVLAKLGTGLSGAITPQIMGEFFVTVTRKTPSPLSQSEALESLSNYATAYEVLDLSAATVLEAIRVVQQHQLSYWTR